MADDKTPAPPPVSAAERIRREFAQAWGAIGAAWGVAPSTAAVQGYFLVHGGPLTEPEIRRALGLSHRAAAMALAECSEWGLIERSTDGRRTGRRGPEAAAYLAVGNNWEWFRRVARARKERETDPVVPVIERCAELAEEEAASGGPDAAELRRLSDRLDGLLRFVHLFDRGVGILVDASPKATQRLFALLDELDDASLRRLVSLLETVDPQDLARATDAIASLPPAAARRLVGLAGTPAVSKILGR
jgi:DNA-binding transcriptional regulator GbsR (MarR family)